MFFLLLLIYIAALIVLFIYPNENNLILPFLLSGALAFSGLGFTLDSLIIDNFSGIVVLNAIFYYLLFVVITFSIFVFRIKFNKNTKTDGNLSSDIDDIWNSL